VDSLALRVAARFAARPIPLDKAAIRKLSEELAAKVAAYAAKHDPEAPMWPADEEIPWSFTIKSVNGVDLQIEGHFNGEHGHSPHLITGGRASKPDLLDDQTADIHVRITLNASKPCKEYLDVEYQLPLLAGQIYSVLVHELTHAAEFQYIRKAPVPDHYLPPEGRAKSFDDYYNSPHEVRAYMQQVIEDIVYKAPGYRKRVAPDLSPHDFVMKLLRTSDKWKQIEHHLNPKNTATILKAVYDALVKRGVLS
jgi:hypothetical protein